MNKDWARYLWLVACREMRERARAKSFKVTTLVLLIAVAAGIALPALLAGGTTVVHVGIVGSTAQAQAEVTEAGRVTGTRVTIDYEPSLPRAKAALRRGDLDVVLVTGTAVLLKQLIGPTSSSAVATVAGAIAQLAGSGSEAGVLPPPDARSQALPIRGLLPPPRSIAVRVTGYSVSLIVYALLLAYGIRITMGVLEEKSSRVVEVLLATLKPSQLLGGKVVGMGLLFLAQVSAMLVVAVITGLATGSHLLRGASPQILVVGFACLIIGYAFYCTAFAMAGSLISRSADAYNASLPMQIPLFVSYIVAETVAFGGSEPLAQVLAYLPPTSPIMDPALYAAGGMTAWQVALSLVACAAATLVTGKLASTVYGRSILMTGSRVRIRQALKARPG